MAGELILVLGRGSPIGIGIFLAGLSGTIYLLAKTDALVKRTKEKENK